MYHFIFTSNVYLYNGFHHLLQEYCHDSRICIIDIESFNSLNELGRTISLSDLGNDIVFFLIQGNGIYSRLLSPVTSCHRDDKLSDIRFKLFYSGGHSYQEVMGLIETCQIAYEKDLFSSERKGIYDSAMRKGSNIKKYYARTKKIADKLGLRNLMQVRYFFQNELSCENCFQDSRVIVHLVKRIKTPDVVKSQNDY